MYREQENCDLQWSDHTSVSLFLPLRKLGGHSVYRKETKSTRVLMELDGSVGGGAWEKRPFPPNWDSCLLQAGDIIPPVAQTLPSSSDPVSAADPSLSMAKHLPPEFPTQVLPSPASESNESPLLSNVTS